MPLLEELTKQLKRDESNRPKPYLDSKQKITIGVGRNLTDNGLRQREIDFMLSNDLDEIDVSFHVLMPWTDGLDEARRGALMNMAFNMGMTKFLGFEQTLAYVRAGQYQQASEEMLNSEWAKQVGDRAKRLSTQMATGLWQ